MFVGKEYYLCDTMLCNLLKVNIHFGGTCCLHLQGQRISQKINQNERGGKQIHLLHADFLLVLFFDPEVGCDIFL
jgi:hypothetical protein